MNNNSREAAPDRSSPAMLVYALIWTFGFLLWFNHFVEQNNDNITRWLLWESLPYNLFDLLDPPASKPGESRWSWLFLFQRIPFALIASGIWIGAWGIGSRLLGLIRIRLKGIEQFFFAMCLGLSATSLIVLLLGLCGSLSRWPLIGVLLFAAVAEVIKRLSDDSSRTITDQKTAATNGGGVSPLGWVVLAVCIPFVLTAWLGAMSPQTDFDVLEYHLGGPKEWFQQRYIARLPHNVYTSFPFLTEMLILSGMVVDADWQWGALAGQAVIAGFAPLIAIGLFAAGRRFFSDAVGWMAALIYLTSPWTYRISIIAYAEGGLSCYLFAALYAALIWRQQLRQERESKSDSSSLLASNREIAKASSDILSRTGSLNASDGMAMVFLAGLLSGSAMACKYTGLVSVVIPIGLILVWVAWQSATPQRMRAMFLVVILFSAGVAAAVGPWLLKNLVETGNPVYPLAVHIFGGKDRDPELDAKWRRGHAAAHYNSLSERMRDLPVKIADVVGNNDWHSPLMFGFAPLTLWVCLRRKRTTDGAKFSEGVINIVWPYVAWQFLTWWLFTHHIDRFYVPMFSAVALLAGVGTRWRDVEPGTSSATIGNRVWNASVLLIAFACMLYNANVMMCLGGFNAGRRDLTEARDAIASGPRIRWINEAYEAGQLPKNTKVLCVGDAQLFHARYPYLYNTVFDHSIFEQLCKIPGGAPDELRSADEIRATFRHLGITHVQVNWSEILRYREPGSYGYTEFAHPDRFTALQRMGILGLQRLPLECALSKFSGEELKPGDTQKTLRKRIEEWAPSLITTYASHPAYFAGQLFPVIDADELKTALKHD